MKGLQDDPTKGWAWDDENRVFMQPSVIFKDRWMPVKISVFDIDNPIYQYDPNKHLLYRDIMNEKDDLAYRNDVTIKNDNIRVHPQIVPELREGVQNKNPTMSGNFDGTHLTIVNRNGNVVYKAKYPAVSGKPDEKGKFDYSLDRQHIRNEGPIPEGNYWINPQKIIRRKDAGLLDIGNRIDNLGKFPGGEDSWGRGKIEINPREVNVDGIKRDNFTIHGGKTPGSKGCIDLTKYDNQFFDFLEKHRKDQDSIPIFVKYPKK